MAAQQIDDYQFSQQMYRPRETMVKVPGQRQWITQPRAINQTELLFPSSQNGQNEVVYETACCSGTRGPITIVTTGKKMVDDAVARYPGMLITAGRMPKRTTSRLPFQTEN